jgi:hypothetical protein
MQGALSKNISGRSRGFLIGVGVLSIAVSGLVIAHPISFGVPLLTTIISIATLITGIQMIAVGIGGRPSKQYSQSQNYGLPITVTLVLTLKWAVKPWISPQLILAFILFFPSFTEAYLEVRTAFHFE